MNGVQIKVTRKGEVRHKKFEERRRQQETERSGASKLHYEIIQNGQNCIRCWKSNKEQYLDDDDWKDLVLTRNVLDECDKECSHVRGYAQFLSIPPFTVILFTEKQLKNLHNKVKTE
ncbi:hypothetical protein CHS0354_008605 [Potamilus streckersoni]|uniref:Uncharacterized protein n=1 Tax=Potamilus streckersoni TaxID=2493646 RepID=A0AAE0W1R6_9BIVA|nr:hypothetical protein CHS0354_008605 [Potamilus streckersoni]